MRDAFYKSKEWFDLRDVVLKRDQSRCQYCGRNAITADHIKPRRRGGRDDMSNLVAVCNFCNGWFKGKDFVTFSEKKAFYDKIVREPMEELLAETRKRERLSGRKFTKEDRRKVRREFANKGYRFINPVLEVLGKPKCSTCEGYMSKNEDMHSNTLCVGCYQEGI